MGVGMGVCMYITYMQVVRHENLVRICTSTSDRATILGPMHSSIIYTTMNPV